MRLKHLLLFCFLTITSFSLYASELKEEPVRAQLIAEEESIQPGRPFWVGIKLNMESGWDTYWMNPGDSGFPTQVAWKLPEGFKAGPLYWPYPQKFTIDSLVAFGYTDTVVLLSQITPPKNLPANENIEIEADVNWLACKEACVPGAAKLSLALPVASGEPQVNGETQPFFVKARQELPKEEGDLGVQAQVFKEEIVLQFKPKTGNFNIEEAMFIPEEGEVIDYAAPQNLSSAKDQLTLKRAHPDNAAPEMVKGVLLLSEKGSELKRAIQVNTYIIQASNAAEPAVEGVSNLSVALGFAFVGGLILNVMPCVLPVIALKIFGFVKMADQRRGVILQHGSIFALGVIVSFWVLSGALLILRTYGEGIGWGFQLQEPIFVAILAGILFLLGLSLFGVFELGTSLISLGGKTSSSGSSPLGSSFMSGVLATLVATPCTGPLLGPALGFAITLPTVKALSVFTSMGLGMAFPYLLFSAFPSLVRYLPKPGNWMITFKQLMGFLMMATVVWLVWVFGAQTDNMATFVLLASLLVMAVGSWIFGRWATPASRKVTRLISMFIAAMMMIIGGSSAILTAKQHRDYISDVSAAPLAATHDWGNYSPERVEALRREGHPVFIDFTAKWCLICQANKVSLRSSDIQSAFKDRNVVTMVADWTKKDHVITQELEKLGRTGVPVYVLYPADLSEKPLILPQTLTHKVILEYLNKLETRTIVHAD